MKIYCDFRTYTSPDHSRDDPKEIRNADNHMRGLIGNTSLTKEKNCRNMSTSNLKMGPLSHNELEKVSSYLSELLQNMTIFEIFSQNTEK